MVIYVEGGDDTNSLRTECRHGFSEFLKKAGFDGRMPRIVACGTRNNAFDSFCTAKEQGETALLLVDSEEVIKDIYEQGIPENWKPWQHLKNRGGDNWEKPENASDEDCHFMVQCMEAWFIADREILKKYFGEGFNENILPNVQNDIEKTDKNELFRCLSEATKNCRTKGRYDKGSHSFKILQKIKPEIVCR